MEIKEGRIDLFKKRKSNRYSKATVYLLPSLLLPSTLIDYEEHLHQMGFENVYLLDKTDGKTLFHKSALLLIFNPSYSFFNEKWQFTEQLFKKRSNFIELIDYKEGSLVFGIWMRTHPSFGNNLRWYFRKGFYSQFPRNYIEKIKEDSAKRICLKDPNYQRGMELKLGLSEGELDGIELDSLVEKEEYTFNFNNYE